MAAVAKSCPWTRSGCEGAEADVGLLGDLLHGRAVARPDAISRTAATIARRVRSLRRSTRVEVWSAVVTAPT